MKKIVYLIAAVVMAMTVGAQTIRNPIIFADFPDPDVIRLGDTYYMVSTTMHHFPGATIVKSKDLVNWEIGRAHV